jgi:hypothetical protein
MNLNFIIFIYLIKNKYKILKNNINFFHVNMHDHLPSM